MNVPFQTLFDCSIFRPPSGGSRKSDKDGEPAQQPSSRPGSAKPPSRPQSAAKSAGTVKVLEFVAQFQPQFNYYVLSQISKQCRP